LRLLRKVSKYCLYIVNDNSYDNIVKSHVFLPFFKKANILIGGEGQEVLIKELTGKIKNRENNLTNNEDITNNNLMNSSFFTNEKRNCQCCSIY